MNPPWRRTMHDQLFVLLSLSLSAGLSFRLPWPPPFVLRCAALQLWALLNFADGQQFFDQKGFKDQFGDLKGSSQVCDAVEPCLCIILT